MVVNLDKKVLKKVVRKEGIIRRKIWKLNETQTRVRVCGKQKSRRDRGDMWWWNEEVKNAT